MSNPLSLIETDTSWEISVNKRPVTRCCIDDQFTIQVADTEVVLEISFEGAFTCTLVEEPDRFREYKLNAENTSSLYPALSVLHKPVELVTAHKSGDITIRFSNGMTLAATSDPDYESWHINGADGLKIVCTPGGALAVWFPRIR